MATSTLALLKMTSDTESEALAFTIMETFTPVPGSMTCLTQLPFNRLKGSKMSLLLTKKSSSPSKQSTPLTLSATSSQTQFL